MKIKRLFSGGLLALAASPWMSGIVMAGTGTDDIPTRTRDFAMAPHEHYDHVLHEIFVDLTIIGVIFLILTVYLLFAYKRKNAGDVGKQPKLSTQAMLGWLIIPSALFLADDLFLFAKAWDLHDNYRKVPKDAYEIKVTGQTWSWSYEYPNGVTTTNELVVPQGQPVLLRMTSNDVIHSHYMNKFRVTEDVVPGRVTYEWFMPNELGESVVTCREYCGMLHSGMYGTVKVVSPADFESWMAAQASAAAPAAEQPTAAAQPAAPATATTL